MCVDVLLYDVTNSLIYKSPSDDIAKYSSRKMYLPIMSALFFNICQLSFFHVVRVPSRVMLLVNNNTYCINVDMISVLIGLSFFC